MYKQMWYKQQQREIQINKNEIISMEIIKSHCLGRGFGRNGVIRIYYYIRCSLKYPYCNLFMQEIYIQKGKKVNLGRVLESFICEWGIWQKDDEIDHTFNSSVFSIIIVTDNILKLQGLKTMIRKNCVWIIPGSLENASGLLFTFLVHKVSTKDGFILFCFFYYWLFCLRSLNVN